MTTGTPGFIGERLKQAREAMGLTTVALANSLGVTRAAISLYENGNATPQAEILSKLAIRLNKPTPFFMKPLNHQEQPDILFFRSMSSVTRTARAMAHAHYDWLVRDIIPFIRQYANYSEPNLITVSESIGNLTEYRIEEIAKAIRRYWGLGDGPISNVTLLFENNGIVVSKMDMCEPELDAFSSWSKTDHRPYILASIDKPSAVRWRFNISHELGHLIMHKNVNPKALSDTHDFKVIEQQAHRFAGAFLLPGETFARDVFTPTLDTLVSLKPKWKVAIGVMINRLANLDIINEDQAKRMWINMNRRGWRQQEPLDNEIPFEQPRLLRKAMELVASQVNSPEQIQEQIMLSSREIGGLTNLPPGFFNESTPQIILKSRPIGVNPKVIDEARSVVDNYCKGRDL